MKRLLSISLATFTLTAFAEEPSAKPSPLFQLKPSAFEKKVELSAKVESAESYELAFDMNSWSELEVESAVAHGTLVKKGDALISLRKDNSQKKKQETAVALQIVEIDVKMARLQFEAEKAAYDQKVDLAKKGLNRKQEDLAFSKSISDEVNLGNVRQSLADAKAALAYSVEELEQLQKMYAEDDLTEETEEIVLERAQNSVDKNRQRLAYAEARAKQTLDLTIPRTKEDREVELATKSRETRQSLAKFPLEARQAELKLKQKMMAFQKQKEAFEKFQADGEKLVLRAPADGRVFYGAFLRGKWNNATNVEKKLKPKMKVNNREPLLTLVKPGKLQVRGAVSEANLYPALSASSGFYRPTALSEKVWPATDIAVDPVPSPDGTYQLTAKLQPRENAGLTLQPTMTGKLSLSVVKLKDALTVPAAAIKTKNGKSFVKMKSGGEREVSTSWKQDGKVLITSGLAAGEQIQPVFDKSQPKKEEAKPKPAAKPQKEGEAQSKAGAKK